MKLKNNFPLVTLAALCVPMLSIGSDAVDTAVSYDDAQASLPVVPPEVGADVLFACDFQETADADLFVTYDRDGLTPSSAMLTLGFQTGTPWIFTFRDSYTSTNYYAGSTSSYNPAGQADDWLVTRDAIAVPESGYVLTWCSQSLDTQLRDGFSVYVSTTGNQPENFTEAPVFTIEEEESGLTTNADGEWVEHTVSLDDYAGQNIWIAFVNDSYDKNVLLLDDISVLRRRVVTLTSLLPAATTDDEVTVTATVTAIDDVVDSFNAYFMVDDDNQYGEAFTGLDLQPGESYTFTITQPMALGEAGGYTSYQLWVECAGVNEVITDSVAHYAFEPQHKVVIEEGTGQWCGWCPMGILSFEYLKEQYPDQFIGIAVHNDDVMTVTEYDRGLGFTAFPTGIANRTVLCQPMTAAYALTGAGTFADAFLAQLALVPEAEVRLTGVTMGADSVLTFTSQTRFALDAVSEDYRLAYVVMSNGFVASGFQVNYLYNGSDYPIFGKFGPGGEWGQQAIVGYPYDDVACCIEPSFDGAAGVIPASPVVGETYAHEFSIDLSQCRNIAEGVGLELVALLIDGTDGSVVNADKYVISSDSGSGIEDQYSDGLTLSYAAGHLTLSGQHDGITVYTTGGMVAMTAGSMVSDLDLSSLADGIYIVSVASDSGRKVMKVVVD